MSGNGTRGGVRPAIAGIGVLLVLFSSGCLPLLLGSARTLKPGEFTVSIAGTNRTSRLSTTEYEQTDSGLGIIEARGGLPGGRIDAGITLHVPWNAIWDIKIQALTETRFTPAVAAQAHLGLLSSPRPTAGGSVIASKRFGPAEISTMGGFGMSNEMIWPVGEEYWSAESRNYVKNVISWGAGAEYHLSPAISFLLSAVSWHPYRERTLPRSGLARIDVSEGPSFYFSGGLRIKWSFAPRKPAAMLTALRGYVLSENPGDEIVVGQPGLYRATVLLDDRTTITAGGEPAGKSDLVHGRAVLIQGLALPRPSTFLARTIELQN